MGYRVASPPRWAVGVHRPPGPNFSGLHCRQPSMPESGATSIDTMSSPQAIASIGTGPSPGGSCARSARASLRGSEPTLSISTRESSRSHQWPRRRFRKPWRSWRLDHRGPGQQHRALPAAGQVANRAAAQPLVHREIIEQNIDAPAFGFRHLGVQRTTHGAIQAQRQQVVGADLRRQGGYKAARAGHAARRVLLRARHNAQKRGLAAPVGGDQAKAVALGDGKIEPGEQGRATRQRKVFDSDQGHGVSHQVRGALRRCVDKG